MQNYLDFEKGLAEIEGKAEELRALARKNTGMNVEDEAAGLDRKAAAMLEAVDVELIVAPPGVGQQDQEVAS